MFLPCFITCNPHHKIHGSQFGNNSYANFFFISSYEIDTNVIHLLILFKHWCHMHCLNTNVICLFVLFKHGCCMFICVVYTWKSCSWLPCLNNAWHSCLNIMNPWNNKFCMNLERTHETYKIVMPWYTCMFVLFGNNICGDRNFSVTTKGERFMCFWKALDNGFKKKNWPAPILGHHWIEGVCRMATEKIQSPPDTPQPLDGDWNFSVVNGGMACFSKMTLHVPPFFGDWKISVAIWHSPL